MRGAWKKLAHLSKKSTVFFAVLFLLLTFLASLANYAQSGLEAAPTQRKVFLPRDGFLFSHNENLEIINLNSKTPAISLERKAALQPSSEDIFLDFETDSLVRNPTHRTSIVEANFERQFHKGMAGQSARFLLRDHRLALKLPLYLHLAGGTLTREVGDFSFACEFSPDASNGTILQRENFVSAKQYLFSIRLTKGRVEATFTNLLAKTPLDQKPELKNATLKSIDKVQLKKRNHLSLTYSEAKGVLTLTLNGREQDTFTLQRESGANYVLNFENLAEAPYVLFPSYRGYADNILFTNRIFSPEEILDYGKLNPYGDKYEQRKGIFYSGIFDMRFSQSTITQISTVEKTTDENLLEVFARCMDRKFMPELSPNDIPFLPIQKMVGTKCRFIQFKGIFTSDNAGKTSPLLKSITLNFRENPPPEAPKTLRVIAVDSESVTFEIPPNTELDVIKRGYYFIYYGHKAHKIEGAVYFTRPPFSTQKIWHKVPIRVKITNDTLLQNKAWADKNPRYKHRYPFFEKGVGYYFWVTACDNAWGESQELADHESLPSEAVFVRFR
ncbi:MAG: hypothetical protein LDLANPLL_01796 [Turneriella sp.]|nr:hypothetical protein [Turneriella sp.]